jgi:hypothetical protein
MQAYDASGFDPPAPMALVTVKSERLDAVIEGVPMLLDTGADVSLLPRSFVERLISSDAERYQLEAFDGTKSSAVAVTAELQFLGKSFRGQFLLVDGSYGILGRNILNSLSILFDGPSRIWMEKKAKG